MRIADTRIGTRIGASFAIIFVIVAMLVAIALLRLNAISQVNDQIIEKEWVKTEAANLINATIRANARRTLELFISSDEAEAARIYEQIGVNKRIIDQALQTLDQLVALPQGKELLARIKETRAGYVASFTRVGVLMKSGARDEATALVKTETLPRLDALQVLVVQLADFQKKIVEGRSAEIKRSIEAASTLLVALALAGCVLGAAQAWWITRSITRPLGRAVALAHLVAKGDLTSHIEASTLDETGQLLGALGEMNANLLEIVSQVRSGTDTIATASEQIAAGNLDLSARTEQQASSLEETASSMEELTGTVRQNADNARQANSLARSASSAASEGGAVVAQVVQTMAGINASSSKIVEIIGVIDSIAFQTNILALNAAVEAARAGEQGRGFAVVASEVRHLAQRSASAAKEIKNLITDSVERVDAGARLADQAGATMSAVVTSVQKVSDIIAEITTASQEQSDGIEQINQAIMQMDTVTQQNAALVEEAASAAASMQDQAGSLAGMVSIFNIGGTPDRKSTVHRLQPRPAAAPATRQSAVKLLANGAPTKDEWESF